LSEGGLAEVLCFYDTRRQRLCEGIEANSLLGKGGDCFAKPREDIPLLRLLRKVFIRSYIRFVVASPREAISVNPGILKKAMAKSQYSQLHGNEELALPIRLV
jgi:hypothetical protein